MPLKNPFGKKEGSVSKAEPVDFGELATPKPCNAEFKSATKRAVCIPWGNEGLQMYEHDVFMNAKTAPCKMSWCGGQLTSGLKLKDQAMFYAARGPRSFKKLILYILLATAIGWGLKEKENDEGLGIGIGCAVGVLLVLYWIFDRQAWVTMHSPLASEDETTMHVDPFKIKDIVRSWWKHWAGDAGMTDPTTTDAKMAQLDTKKNMLSCGVSTGSDRLTARNASMQIKSVRGCFNWEIFASASWTNFSAEKAKWVAFGFTGRPPVILALGAVAGAIMGLVVLKDDEDLKIPISVLVSLIFVAVWWFYADLYVTFGLDGGFYPVARIPQSKMEEVAGIALNASFGGDCGSVKSKAIKKFKGQLVDGTFATLELHQHHMSVRHSGGADNWWGRTTAPSTTYKSLLRDVPYVRTELASGAKPLLQILGALIFGIVVTLLVAGDDDQGTGIGISFGLAILLVVVWYFTRKMFIIVGIPLAPQRSLCEQIIQLIFGVQPHIYMTRFSAHGLSAEKLAHTVAQMIDASRAEAPEYRAGAAKAIV